MNSNTRRRLSIPDIGGPNMKRRLSIPELKSLKDVTGGQRKSDCSDLPEGGAVLSRSLLSMDRAITPEVLHDPNLDRSFTNLRPASPGYISELQQLNGLGNSVDLSDEDCDTEKSAKLPKVYKPPPSPFKDQQFQVIQPKSKSKRHLIKIPIETKKAQKNAVKYPASMLSYERGVAPTRTAPQMNLVELEEPSLSNLRAKAKIKISKNIRKNMEVMQLKFAAKAMEPEFEQMEKEMSTANEQDLLHFMDDDGQIIWKNIDKAETESIIDSDIDLMPTLDQNNFQDLDPEDILDAFLTDKYIVLETDQPY